MYYLLNPKLHKIESKRDINKSDVWPVDLISNGKKVLVMTSEGVCVPYKGYIGYYSHRDLKKGKKNV